MGPGGFGFATRQCRTCDFLARTARERDALWTFRDQHCNQPFVPDSDETTMQLNDIWSSAFPGEQRSDIPRSEASPTAADQIPSDSWKQLGFQCSDPRKDVR